MNLVIKIFKLHKKLFFATFLYNMELFLDTTHYINSHPDLVNASLNMNPVNRHKFALRHFRDYGIKENRIHITTKTKSNKVEISKISTSSQNNLNNNISSSIYKLIKDFRHIEKNTHVNKIRDKTNFCTYRF